MFIVLLLTSLVGLTIGLTISSLARTSEVAIGLLPLILLPMLILAGVMQPVHKMNSAIQVLAHVMPSRWAFEGLLLLEADERPTWVPLTMPTPSAGDASTETPPGPVTDETADVTGAAPSTSSEAADARRENAAEQPAPEPKDMAEDYFPANTERKGVRASCISLVSMLICLVAAIHVILRSRDIH
jgi:hypothetical protein